MRVLRSILATLAGCLLLAPAFAEVSAADLQILARALSFLEKPPVGEVSVGIVYSPGNAPSVREAEAVQGMLRDGLKVGNLTLKGEAVPVSQLGRVNVDLILLTGGLNEEANSVAEISRSRHLVCVTTDLAQVRKGTCLMGIRSVPKIEILVNQAVAATNGTKFSTVFRMLITEI